MRNQYCVLEVSSGCSADVIFVVGGGEQQTNDGAVTLQLSSSVPGSPDESPYRPTVKGNASKVCTSNVMLERLPPPVVVNGIPAKAKKAML
jgi:hypothetical protein